MKAVGVAGDYYYEEREDGTLMITGCTGGTDLVIPSEIGGKSVTSIVDSAFHYYVVAYALQQDTSITSYVSYLTASSYGNSKSASAVYAGKVAKPKAPTVSVKAGKKSATLTIKKVANASGYAIYRSSKKKGTYQLVALTTKTKFKDSGLTAKKRYFYKVKAVSKSLIGTDVYSAFSKVKNVKAK